MENYCKGRSLAPRIRKSRRKDFDELFNLFADGRELSNSRVRHYHVLQRLIHRYEVYIRVSMPRMVRLISTVGMWRLKRLICAPEVPASQMVLTIITDEQLETFADAVITKYQQNIAETFLSVSVFLLRERQHKYCTIQILFLSLRK